MKLSAIILAGGYSSRMGSPKAALELEGKTLLQHQAEKLRRLGISEILISGWEDCPPGTEAVTDIYPHCGPLSGIHAGLCRVRNPAALVLPVDMPLIAPETLRNLVQSHAAAPITLLEFRGQVEPLVGIYSKELAERCAVLLESGRFSPRQLFSQVAVRTVPHTGDPAELAGCNTPEEYREVLAQYHRMYQAI